MFRDQYQQWVLKSGESPHHENIGIFGSYDDKYEKIYENKQLVKMEYAIDFIYCVEIIMNFLKRSNAYNDIRKISINYLQGKFIFDIIATIPGLINSQNLNTYRYKLFRMVHLVRLTEPLLFIMKFLLKSYSKKR